MNHFNDSPGLSVVVIHSMTLQVHIDAQYEYHHLLQLVMSILRYLSTVLILILSVLVTIRFCDRDHWFFIFSENSYFLNCFPRMYPL
jgi:hypothetical protein